MLIGLSFCFFVLLMFVAGNLSNWRKKQHSSEDYLMAGRSHGKFTVALSGAASAATGFVMIGAVGVGYSWGILGVLMPLGWLFGDYIFWTFFPDRINRQSRDSNSSTIPEFVSYFATGERSSAVRKLLAVVSIVFVGMFAAGQFVAAGKAVNAVFDLPLMPAVFITAVFIAACSAKGGLESSIPTQFVQALIMLATTVGMFVLSLALAGGPGQLVNELYAINPDLLSLDGGKGIWVPLGIFLGMAGAAFAYDMGTPQLLVRIMASKSPEEAAASRWVYIGFMQSTWIAMTLFGLIMNLFLPEIADPEKALPAFAREYAHPIIAGAIMAGIFAAVASTLDGQLLVISSSIGVDMSPRFYRRMTDKWGVNYQSVITLAVTGAVAVVAVSLGTGTSVFWIIAGAASALGATLGLAFFIALMRWRTSTAALFIGITVAVITVTLWRYFGLSQYVIEGFPGFAVGLVAHQLALGAFRKGSDKGRTNSENCKAV